MTLLVTGAWEYTPNQISNIKNLGHRVTLLQDEKDAPSIPYNEIDGVICNSLFLYHPIMWFTSLKFIQLTSVGYDRTPMEYVNEHNIEIHNAYDVYSIPMAEFAMSGVLQIYKQSRFFSTNQKKKKWEKHRGLLELFNKTVCVVGCGSVGTECAKRFRAFGCRVVGIGHGPKQAQHYSVLYPLEDLYKVIPMSDIVVLAIPLVQQTVHLFDQAVFNSMKPGAILVNIARGAIVDTNALIMALSNNLGGAVLDVFEEEPLCVGSPLWGLNNVIITPHNSFVSDMNNNRLYQVILDNLEHIGL